MIRLLVDSASDYTQEEIENKNLYFVPLQIQIEGKNYLDGCLLYTSPSPRD